ncbi:MAG: cardiolipin synthase B [Pseudomonadales bacterium]|jgi:cardiolipin synthase A/B|nr:cardiolipin synthase B [Pseudomonadales bacterium]MEC8810761.1 phospholipase D-like domain-containing protein [Pseudomonadota bacterium]TNC90723.1 MAG: cardiolipin synthase B [Alcanivorax sp.]HBO95969.1 cardiolipin synthase B [Gammaproteobacteria bacterium]MAQ24401.1 cardiolipin synthase B [Pseudomonadales bacterium]|tara:strand:+ start:15075 stop:16259 length:1185 start_codon:yes stop_codon:yes gene_type:complete
MNLASTDSFTSILPWRTDNHYQLLVDGDQFYPRIIDALSNARSAIDIEMYLFESGAMADRFIDALIAAKERGVYVRVLLDHIGSHNLRHNDRERLRSAGADLRFFNRVKRSKRLRNFSRDHRKIVLVDCQVAFTGGAGVTDDFSAEHRGHRAWHDAMVEIRGQLVHDWQLLFERSWQHYDSIHDEELRAKLRLTFHSDNSAPLMNRTLPQGRVVASRGLGNKPIIGSLISEVNKSSSRAWLCTAYFYPSRKLVKALRKAAQRGVDVRIILPGDNTDHPSVRYAGRTWYRILLEYGVRIFEYQPRFLHLKAAVVDDWLTVGSCNFDRWNLHWNLEANLEALDPGLNETIHQLLEKDLESCTEIALSRWKARSWHEKIRERFWKWVAMFLARLPND